VVDETAIRYSIAYSAPAKPILPVISLFVPMSSIILDYKNNRITWEQYVERYLAPLRVRYFDISDMLKTLSDKQQGNMELCCWETIKHPHCHRALVADVINKVVAFEGIKNIQASVHDLNGIL
jgi:hypothetical protein